MGRLSAITTLTKKNFTRSIGGSHAHAMARPGLQRTSPPNTAWSQSTTNPPAEAGRK